MTKLSIQDIIPELIFTTSRSSGAGGQHVNKTETKVTIRWNINSTELLTSAEKERVEKKLINRINNNGEIILNEESSRSQARNKKLLVDRLIHLINQSLTISKARKKTKPTKEAREKRLKEKKSRSEIKASRKKLDY